MAGYPKIWVIALFTDEWFLGLSLTERGVWLQLILLAKMWGDSGEFSSKFRHLADNIGADKVTTHKILRKFDSDKRISLVENENGTIRIKIHNYKHYQLLRDESDLRNSGGKIDEKSTKNRHQPNLTEPNRIKIQKVFAEKFGEYRFQNLKLTVADLDSLIERYSQKDLANEFFKMDAWLGGHPNKRKGLKMFAINWLEKTPDRPQAATGIKPKVCKRCGKTVGGVDSDGICFDCMARPIGKGVE